MFRPNRKFKKAYNKLYREDPLQANLFLLLCELADENGQVETSSDELMRLAEARFNDPEEYAL
jgi:hypothetical protein